MTAPILVFGYGNPSRGDDALGPEFVRRLAERYPELIADGTIDVLTDFQLQVEHALDLRGREQVYFVDATSEWLDAGYDVRRVAAGRIRGHTSHALSPEALLGTYAAVVGKPAPETFVIAIQGNVFGLGAPMSGASDNGLEAALDHFVRGLGAGRSAVR